MEIKGIFPTPIGKIKFYRDFTKEELDFIISRKKCHASTNFLSLDKQVLKNELMAEIGEFLHNSCNDYFRKIYNPINDVSLKITQSWFHYSRKNQSHHAHTHQNSFISGVLYIIANSNSDRISFIDSRNKPFKIPCINFTEFNPEAYTFCVESGDLILFHSDVIHEVPVVNTDMRISLPFNTFFDGFLGQQIGDEGFGDVNELKIKTL